MSEKTLDRRTLMISAGLSTMAGISAAASGKSVGWVERLLKRRFVELSDERREEILAELEEACRKKYGRDDITVSDTQALDGVEFAYGLDLSRCVGCRRCVYACVHENNQSRDPQIHCIRVLEMKKDHGIDFAESDI